MATTLLPNATALLSNATVPYTGGEVELPFEWNGGLITVSYLVAVAASYSTVQLLQLRLHPAMMLLGALTLSVAGIWSMHFVGMEALHLGVEMTFEPVLTAFSAVFAFVCTAIGFAIVHWRVTSAAGHRVRQAAIDISVRAHVKALCNAPHGAIIASGQCIAAGVCSMHYGGMAAMQVAARSEPVVSVIVLSCVIAMAAATAALYLAFVLPLSRRFVLPTALVMGVAVCGMHYTGMYGFRYWGNPADPTFLDKRRGSHEIVLTPYVVCGSLLLSMLTLAYTSIRYQQMIENAVRKFELYVPPAIVECVFNEDVSPDEDTNTNKEMADAVASQSDRRTARTGVARRASKSMSNRESMPGGAVDDEENEVTIANAIATMKMHPSIAFHNESDGLDAEEGGPFARTARTRAVDVYQHAAVSESHGGETTTTTSMMRKVNWLDQKMRPAFASVMFVDVVDFTTHAERMSQDELLREMNAFNGRCTRAIEGSGGVVDKYLGDAIMAVWNTVQRVSDHGARAVATAVRCAAKPPASERLRFEAKAGVQSGPVLMGNVGCDTKLNFTVLGDTVNQASRIEGLTRHYGARVMIGAGTRDLLAADGSGFVVRFLDEAVLKGKKKSVLLFEVMADAVAGRDGAAITIGGLSSQQESEDSGVAARQFALRRAELVAAAYECLHAALRTGDWRVVLSYAAEEMAVASVNVNRGAEKAVDDDDDHLFTNAAMPDQPSSYDRSIWAPAASVIRPMAVAPAAGGGEDRFTKYLRGIATAAKNEGLVGSRDDDDDVDPLVPHAAGVPASGGKVDAKAVIRQLLAGDTPTKLLVTRADEMKLAIGEMGETVVRQTMPKSGVVHFTSK